MSGTQGSAPGAAQRQLQALSTAPSSQEPSRLGRGVVLGAGTTLANPGIILPYMKTAPLDRVQIAAAGRGV